MGQNIEFLFIGCADSRVRAGELMWLKPGEVFIHRNIASMVPDTVLCSRSVVRYAVTHLKVKPVNVCLHYECRSINAALQPADLGLLNPWLRNIRDVYRLPSYELNSIDDVRE